MPIAPKLRKSPDQVDKQILGCISDALIGGADFVVFHSFTASCAGKSRARAWRSSAVHVPKHGYTALGGGEPATSPTGARRPLAPSLGELAGVFGAFCRHITWEILKSYGTPIGPRWLMD